MKCICSLIVYLMVISVLSLCPAYAAESGSAVPSRGIAVLASSIGNDCSPEELADFVQQAKLSPVVVDWAWITYHWGYTDFTAVNRFLDLMAAAKVPVAAMYRPRFISSPTVSTQVGTDGKAGMDHVEICYSDPSARKWGISWGTKILEKCPRIDEIVVYNPMDNCNCPKCSATREKGQYTNIVSFLSEARSAWQAERPGVKLGLVSMPESGLWKASLEAVDVAHPYLCVREELDPAKDVANIKAMQAIVKQKMGSCLAKITWEEGEKVSMAKLSAVDNLAAKEGIPYFFWTFDTLFRSSLYDRTAVAQALNITLPKTGPLSATASVHTADAGSPAQTSVTETSASGGGPEGEKMYSPEQIKSISAEKFLELMANPDPRYWRFAPLNALAQKAKDSDAATRRSIVAMVTAVMYDKNHTEYQRFQCCYVIGDCGDEQGVPDLIQILFNDPSETMRSVAAEALGKLPDCAAAHEALLKSANTETSPRVREVLARRLGITLPDPRPKQAPVPVRELAPSGAPVPPAGPARPVKNPLPWPFPGDSKAQNIFNNYQTATDDYIHCGLDFIHPAGTKVRAVASGYVAVITTNYPDWITHYFFIVTPEKGSSRGWCYTHIDPRTFTFKQGDYIKQGQVLGKLVKFSVGSMPGMDHLHLHYVSFAKNAKGQVDVHSLIDPLYFFDWKDTEPPVFLPLWFTADGSNKQFQPDASGVVTVSGRVDILTAITDNAYPGQEAYQGIPLVMLSISDGTHTMQKLVLDQRGDVGNETQVKPLYLSRDEARTMANPGSFFPYYQVMRVTKTDGDGKITQQDANQCWDTTARDRNGALLWPNGTYAVNVYAWDAAGNKSSVGAVVQVRN